MIYDNPIYTKTWLTAAELFAILDACPRVAGVKMTDHNLDKITALKRQRGSGPRRRRTRLAIH